MNSNGDGISEDLGYTLNATDVDAVVFDTTQITSPDNFSNPKPRDPCHPLAAGAHVPAVAFYNEATFKHSEEICHTLRSRNTAGGVPDGVMRGMQVRRLTPTECARLQGFPDDNLDIEFRGKPAADGPKYKALGNSMAVPCMRWIGERIHRVIAGGGVSG